LMIGGKGLCDLVMIQQMGCSPCVFGKDKVNFPEHFNCPKGYVFEIANRSGNEIEHEFEIMVPGANTFKFSNCDIY